MALKAIPDIVVGRLPKYLQALKRMQAQGQSTTSSKELGDRLGISAAQIRKDLSQFGGFGKQGTGYDIRYLIDQIQTILNLNKIWDVVLVGAGDLGHALARYQGLSNRGFRIAMVFDSDAEKVGAQIGAFTIQDSAELGSKVQAAAIKVAMLTVPASAAQEVAETLVKAGVRAILNYTPVPLNLPSGVRVQQIDPILQLQHMAYYLT